MKYIIEKNDQGKYPLWEVVDETGFLWAVCYTPTEAEETAIRLIIRDRADYLRSKIYEN